jgi:anthranilate phosphoribosyltransferase
VRLGAEKALVVHSADGLDEISLCDRTLLAEAEGGQVRIWHAMPQDFGLRPARLDHLLVRSVQESAEVIEGVLGGRRGPQRDMVLLNAGAAVYVGGKAPSVAEGVVVAAEAIDSGRARHVLERLVRLTAEAAGDAIADG